MLRRIYDIKQAFLQRHVHLPFLPSHNDRNRFYFLTARKEREIMLRLLEKLADCSDLQSVIWLHDGVWVYPKPPDATLEEVFRKALPEDPESSTLFRAQPVITHILSCDNLANVYQDQIRHENFRPPHSTIPELIVKHTGQPIKAPRAKEHFRRKKLATLLPQEEKH